MTTSGGASAGEAGKAGPRTRHAPRRDEEGDEATEPCLRCGVPLPRRLMGCKGGHCPNCSHPYPHGDCSD